MLKNILKGLFKFLFSIKVSNENNLYPKSHNKKLIIISNHESLLDGIILGLFLPMNPVFVVHSEVVKNWKFRLVLRLVDYIAIDPTSPMAIKKIVRIVESERPVVIFPEGRITTTGSLMKVYEGPAFIAAKTGANILPIQLKGLVNSYLSRSGGNKELFPAVTITAFPLEKILTDSQLSARESRRKSGDKLRVIMQKMAFNSNNNSTLYKSLIDIAKKNGSNCKIVEDIKQVEYSYRDLIKMTLSLGYLVKKHSQEGECVGIVMPNLAATVCMTIGAGLFNRVPAMINYKSGASGMLDSCIAANVKTIFTSRAFLSQAKLETDMEAISKSVKILYLEDIKGSLTLLDKLWILSGVLCPESVLEEELNPEAIAVVLFTSGSEGKPKGVALSHRALLSNINQIKSVIDFSQQDKVLNALPIFHSFGLTGGALLPILTGMKLFLYATPLHYRVIPEIAYDRNCTVLFGTNTFLANYAKFANPYDFFKLRFVVAGAEKLSQSTKDTWFDKFGLRVMEGYGATETAPVLAVNTPMAYRYGTVGQFLPGIEYRIVKVEGIELGGMLHVRGPNLMSGYYKYDNPGVLQPSFSELGLGWYETGDIVSICNDNFITIQGRVKRFAKIAGEMVSLEVVEKLVNSLKGNALSVKENFAAISVPDVNKGEMIVLFATEKVTLIRREDIFSQAKSLNLSELNVPRKIVKIDDIPLLGTGKTDYVSLKKLYENNLC